LDTFRSDTYGNIAKVEQNTYIGFLKKQRQVLQFCQSLLNMGSHRGKAMTNHAMSLAGSPKSTDPEDLNLSDFSHYYCSNQTKVLENWELKSIRVRKIYQAVCSKCSEKSRGFALIRLYTRRNDATNDTNVETPF
jgi:hypothetical protein